MQKKVILVVVAAILAVSLLAGFVFTENANPAPLSLQHIYIRQDGSVSPVDAPIQRSGDIYTFTSDLYATITIQRSGIVLNGAGYTLRGPYTGTQSGSWVVGDGPAQASSAAEYIIGVDFGGKNVDGVTIENIAVQNFSIGMYVWTENNTVCGNSVSDNIVGILLSGQNNSVVRNRIENNQEGLFLGFNNGGNQTIPSDIKISHNDFEANEVQLNGCQCENINSTESPHNWDDGRQGNFWSDYTGADSNLDGVGDTAYVVDVLNRDRYPLMESPVQPLTPPYNLAALIPFILVFIVLALAALLAVRFLRKRK